MNRLAKMLLGNFWKLPGAYRKLCFYAKHTDEYAEQEKYDYIRSLFQLAMNKSNVTLEHTGAENIPEENGFMVYANHQGLFDVIALTVTCPNPLACVFKYELRNTPVLKQIIACTKSFAMDREDVRQSLTVIRGVSEEVKKGRNYLIFPEGTRSKKGNTMVDFHSGSFKAALKAKCPILPVAFVDSFKALDQKGCAPITVGIHYLPVIPYEDYKDMNTVELAAYVKEKIQQSIDAHKGKVL